MAKAVNRISKNNGYEANTCTYYPVLIVGAGESGIAMGCRLKEKLGCDQFRIVDRQAGIGGTWWINRYPGVACDVPALFYSFSFSPKHDWSSYHPPGPEIVTYLQEVCEKYQIVDKIQLNTDVTELRWLEDEGVWEATLTHLVAGAGDLSAKDRAQKVQTQGWNSVYTSTEVVRCKAVASCVGGLVEPKGWPDHIPGYETFEGKTFHSARWDYETDFNNKNVVVMGTGCSAAQFVPKLTKPPFNAKSVMQVMRSPPWVVPRAQPPGGEEWWSKWSPTLLGKVPGLARLWRFKVFLDTELEWGLFGAGLFGGGAASEKLRKEYEKELVTHIKKTVPEQYVDDLTPSYSVGCKRRINDATWFPGLHDPRLDLTTRPISKVNFRSVTLGPRRTKPDPKKQDSQVATDEIEVPADIIVLANGFDTQNWLHPLRVIGKGGKSIHDVWRERGGAQAYYGSSMDGFPNFFLVFGPNTATGHSSVILATENQVEYALNFFKPILRGDVSEFDVKKEAEINYTADIQKSLKTTVWMSGGCAHSWYKGENGWNATTYPYSQWWFTYRCLFPIWNDWNIRYTTKGYYKHIIAQFLKFTAFTTVIIALYRARKTGVSLNSVSHVARQYLSRALEISVKSLESFRMRV